MQEQVCCVFVIHPRNVCIPIFSRIISKLSVACRNQDIARHTRRKEFLQLQFDIVCVVKEEKPVSLAPACKPTQTRTDQSLSIFQSDGLKILLKSLFIGRVNVEDIGEAENKKYKLSLVVVISYIVEPYLVDSRTNLKASWLFPEPPRPCKTKTR